MEAQSQPISSLNPLVDEVENISQQIRKDLECPVCMELASKIHCCCVNGHIVCESCLLRLWQFSDFPACPMCRSVLSTAVFKSAFVLAITNLMNSFKITCSNRAHGCLELVSIASINEHESSCTYVPDVKCFVSTCQWSGIYAQIFNHVKSVHPTSAVKTRGQFVTFMASLTAYKEKFTL
ncbi:E3 ubiquitin-protein ligase sina-like [Daktulosphaira vitifoliae]|uniref:E3 ubiquitin-protein ligase sina-like n=1 Tax=Daktulosphaira vitifoliae TaxID=58002 RepID=UPI0021A9C865|nr:E3 ubiquitin-protein ligase sina-like [Daktulosphaira vitifoliae]